MIQHSILLLAVLLGPAQSKQPGSIQVRFDRAVELFNEHDDTGEALDEAEKEFALVLKLDPRHAAARAYQGLIALEHGKQAEAERAFSDALAIDRACAEARVGRVHLLRSKAQWKESYDEARLAVRLAPGSKLALWELVSCLVRRAEAPVTDTERNEAEPLLKRILTIDPDARQAHLDLGDLYGAQSRWREAIRHYKEVLRIGQTSEDMDVWVYEVNKTVAECYEHLGDHPRALEFLVKYHDERIGFGESERDLQDVNQRIAELKKKASGKK